MLEEQGSWWRRGSCHPTAGSSAALHLYKWVTCTSLGIYSPICFALSVWGKCNLTPLCLDVSRGQCSAGWNVAERSVDIKPSSLLYRASILFCRGRHKALLAMYPIQIKWHQPGGGGFVLQRYGHEYLGVGRISNSQMTIKHWRHIKDVRWNSPTLCFTWLTFKLAILKVIQRKTGEHNPLCGSVYPRRSWRRVWGVRCEECKMSNALAVSIDGE